MRRTPLVIAIASVFASACVVGEDLEQDPLIHENGDLEEGIAESTELEDFEADELVVADDAGGAELLEIEATANLLRNGGFETGASWQQDLIGSGSTVVRSWGARYRGSYGLRIRSGPGLDPAAMVIQTIDVIPGRKYTVSAFTRMRPVGQQDQQRLEVWWRFENGGGYVASTVGTGTSTAWHKISRKVTAPQGVRRLSVVLGDVWDDLYGSTHEWDSISVVAQ